MISQALKVLRLAKKPTFQELKSSLRIAVAGFLILGIIGYLFQLIAYILIG